jgi:hypothetical protein
MAVGLGIDFLAWFIYTFECTRIAGHFAMIEFVSGDGTLHRSAASKPRTYWTKDSDWRFGHPPHPQELASPIAPVAGLDRRERHILIEAVLSGELADPWNSISHPRHWDGKFLVAAGSNPSAGQGHRPMRYHHHRHR